MRNPIDARDISVLNNEQILDRLNISDSTKESPILKLLDKEDYKNSLQLSVDGYIDDYLSMSSLDPSVLKHDSHFTKARRTLPKCLVWENNSMKSDVSINLKEFIKSQEYFYIKLPKRYTSHTNIIVEYSDNNEEYLYLLSIPKYSIILIVPNTNSNQLKAEEWGIHETGEVEEDVLDFFDLFKNKFVSFDMPEITNTIYKSLVEIECISAKLGIRKFSLSYEFMSHVRTKEGLTIVCDTTRIGKLSFDVATLSDLPEIVRYIMSCEVNNILTNALGICNTVVENVRDKHDEDLDKYGSCKYIAMRLYYDGIIVGYRFVGNYAVDIDLNVARQLGLNDAYVYKFLNTEKVKDEYLSDWEIEHNRHIKNISQDEDLCKVVIDNVDTVTW